jgi:L-iditol 2-dehydrogenase
MTMLAAQFYGPMDIRMEQCPIPHPGPGEVVVQIAAATTCGTDLKSYRRGHPVLFPRLPSPFGHEMAGIISEVGKDVTRFSEGDAVAIANSAPCMQCYFCRKKRYSLCEDLLFLNGAYSEYALVPERIVRLNLYKLTTSTSLIAAALAEPLACALHGIDACRLEADQAVAILGCGPLGLLLIALAKRQGVRVIATGRGEERLRLARRYGAHITLDVAGMSIDEQREAIRAETEGHRGVDVAIEAVGTPETWQLAANVTQSGGLVNFFGGCAPGTKVGLDTFPLHYGELRTTGVFHHTPAYFAQALELIESGQIDVEALITARLPLTELLQAFDLLLNRQGIKYALIPPAFEQALLTAAAHR